MTELEVRKKAVNAMLGFEGASRGSSKHKQILQIYNTHQPLARNYQVQIKDSWCATTVSAAFISAGLTDIFPTECSCSKLIELNKAQKTWQEDDSYVPKIGDCVVYDWDDNGKGDSMGIPDHIGMVIAIKDNEMTILEGNKGSESKCGRRILKVNGRYIRGFITPNFLSKATNAPLTAIKGYLPVLDYGASGTYVKIAQLLMNEKLHINLEIDGRYGPATADAAKKLCSNGKIDSLSWKVLLAP